MKSRCRQEAIVTLLRGEKLRKRIPEPQIPAQERMYVLQVAVLEEWGSPSPLKSIQVMVPQAPDAGYGADLSFHSSFLEQKWTLLATACWETKEKLHLWGCEEATHL